MEGQVGQVGQAGGTGLYMQVMGESWIQIAEPVRCAHETDSILRAHGHVRVERGHHYFSRVLGRLLRLPHPTAAADTRLTVTSRAGGERWERRFNGRRLETWQYQSNAGELAERFGVLEFRFRLDAACGSLLYVQREAALRCGSLRLRIPGAWAPRVEAREDPAGSKRIKVDVRVFLPGVGPLISYAGIVHVEDACP